MRTTRPERPTDLGVETVGTDPAVTEVDTAIRAFVRRPAVATLPGDQDATRRVVFEFRNYRWRLCSLRGSARHLGFTELGEDGQQLLRAFAAAAVERS